MKTLSIKKKLDIRFSEVDSMGVVWHGSYMLYLEDAREAFGEKYDLGYLRFFGEGYYAPLVDVQLKYKQPITMAVSHKPTSMLRMATIWALNPLMQALLTTHGAGFHGQTIQTDAGQPAIF